jgi:hypothetical protein
MNEPLNSGLGCVSFCGRNVPTTQPSKEDKNQLSKNVFAEEKMFAFSLVVKGRQPRTTTIISYFWSLNSISYHTTGDFFPKAKG